MLRLSFFVVLLAVDSSMDVFGKRNQRLSPREITVLQLCLLKARLKIRDEHHTYRERELYVVTIIDSTVLRYICRE